MVSELGEVDVNTRFLTVTGKAVGDTATITVGRKLAAVVRIVGEAFDPWAVAPPYWPAGGR